MINLKDSKSYVCSIMLFITLYMLGILSKDEQHKIILDINHRWEHD